MRNSTILHSRMVIGVEPSARAISTNGLLPGTSEPVTGGVRTILVCLGNGGCGDADTPAHSDGNIDRHRMRSCCVAPRSNSVATLSST